MCRLLVACALVTCIHPTNLPAQEIDSLEAAQTTARSSAFSPVQFLLPQALRTGYILRDLIRSPAFGTFDSAHTPSQVFNEIYYTSLALSHGDLSDALFAASFGTLEHEQLPFDLFGHELLLPITSETHNEFERRLSHLPAYLYNTIESDRDKLQHFYAGAWLKSWLGMDWLVALAGEAVEFFESTLLEGSSRDPRDIHANLDGAHFATKAAENHSEPPSKSLTPNP